MTRWRDLKAGDRILLGGVVRAVIEVVDVDGCDWDEDDWKSVQLIADAAVREPWTFSAFLDLRPLYVVLEDPAGVWDHLRLPIAWQLISAHNPTLLPEHHPVCGACGAFWPCVGHLIDHEVATFARRLAQTPSADRLRRNAG